jgi:protein gp37
LHVENEEVSMSTSELRKLVAQSWNPFTGCTKTSPACKNCYAEPMALKLMRWGTAGYENGFQFAVHKDRLEKAAPLRRKKPTLYFINNMSDTFHEDADEQSIDRIMHIVKQAHWHNFYILTKRSERMRAYFDRETAPDNLWLGVTVENRKHGLPRLKDLQQTNGMHKHICCEPLLEDLGNIDLMQVKLVVGGGESGPNARRAHLSWVESLQRQCQTQNVYFYWKQWGSYGQDGLFRGKGKTGYLVNGKALQSFPESLMP